jgi:hypothetical protein
MAVARSLAVSAAPAPASNAEPRRGVVKAKREEQPLFNPVILSEVEAVTRNAGGSRGRAFKGESAEAGLSIADCFLRAGSIRPLTGPEIECDPSTGSG